jgi:hypothetical protein
MTIDDLVREVLADSRVAGPSNADAERLRRWVDLVCRVPESQGRVIPRRET